MHGQRYLWIPPLDTVFAIARPRYPGCKKRKGFAAASKTFRLNDLIRSISLLSVRDVDTHASLRISIRHPGYLTNNMLFYLNNDPTWMKFSTFMSGSIPWCLVESIQKPEGT